MYMCTTLNNSYINYCILFLSCENCLLAIFTTINVDTILRMRGREGGREGKEGGRGINIEYPIVVNH